MSSAVVEEEEEEEEEERGKKKENKLEFTKKDERNTKRQYLLQSHFTRDCHTIFFV